jgi:hypothetical protein
LATGRVPVTPVDKGRPVPLVRVTEVGVPRTGVTSVGEVERTLLPEPVLAVTPVPPFATGNVPVTPVVRGRPVALVRVPLDGVPRAPPLASRVPDVGRVTVVVPVTVSVVVNAPENVTLPPKVRVPLLLTPVPPLVEGRTPVTDAVRDT